MISYNVDYLHDHKEYLVAQGLDMYHFNTDTCLLGDYIKVNKKDRILDVGTNNGALLVYCHYLNAKRLTGIDINKKALKYAKITAKLNHFKARFIAKDFKKYRSLFRYDIIISNPPYFPYDKANKNPTLYDSRNNHLLPLNEMFISFNKNLKTNGIIYMVYRKELLERLKKVCLDNNFEIVDLKEIGYTILVTLKRS